METLPLYPYTKDQIDDYLRIHLVNHVGKAWRHEHYQERVGRWIEALSNWAQIILLEEGITLELGDRKHTGLASAVIASADPFALHIKVGAYQSSTLEISLGHELGHLFDRILGQVLSGDPDESLDYSEDVPEWSEALKRETARPKKGRTELNNHFRKELFSSDYDIIDRESEAFAMMYEHYFERHRHRHTEEDIRKAMTKHFPQLWPAFETEVITPLKAHAADLWEYRQQLQSAPATHMVASR